MRHKRIAITTAALSILVLMYCWTLLVPTARGAEPEATIPSGTIITEQNWQQYKQFMNPGLQAMWAGTYEWKLGPNFQMVVGPTMHYESPSQFKKYTEQYSGQVRIETLPDGRHILKNYVAGLPFPNPQEPMKGWKILANDWFAYVPAVICNDSVVKYPATGWGM